MAAPARTISRGENDMRLIDADALLEKVWDADTRCGYVQVVDRSDIEDAPTIEPKCEECRYLNQILLDDGK